jgi:hypothetical protein
VRRAKSGLLRGYGLWIESAGAPILPFSRESPEKGPGDEGPAPGAPCREGPMARGAIRCRTSAAAASPIRPTQINPLPMPNRPPTSTLDATTPVHRGRRLMPSSAAPSRGTTNTSGTGRELTRQAGRSESRNQSRNQSLPESGDYFEVVFLFFFASGRPDFVPARLAPIPSLASFAVPPRSPHNPRIEESPDR